MPDETKLPMPADEITDPAERAKANGYIEPTEPTKEERAAALVAHIEHAMHHNAPIGKPALAELKALLGVEEASDVNDEADQPEA